jgi:hypothetical protein
MGHKTAHSGAGAGVRGPGDTKNLEHPSKNRVSLVTHGFSLPAKRRSGNLIDRLVGLGGAALLAFFTTYEAKLTELIADCRVCSDDDAWHSYINPWNGMAENIALVYAFAAAWQVQRSEDEEFVRAPTPSNSHRYEDD